MTEAQRKANRKWDSAHYTQLPCKIRKDKAEAFKSACYAAGTTPNAVLTAAADTFMADHGGWDAWLSAGAAAASPAAEEQP